MALLPVIVRVVGRDGGVRALCGLCAGAGRGAPASSGGVGGGRSEVGIDGAVLVRPGRGGELELVVWVVVGVYVAVGVFGRPLADVYACDDGACMSVSGVGKYREDETERAEEWKGGTRREGHKAGSIE